MPFRKVQKALVAIGFAPVRQKGSHVTLQHPDGRVVTLPNHPGKDVARGTLRAVLSRIDVSFDEFEKHL